MIAFTWLAREPRCSTSCGAARWPRIRRTPAGMAQSTRQERPASRGCEQQVSGPVGSLEPRPEPGPPDARRMIRTHARQVTPGTERDERDVRNGETHAEILAHETADESSRRENVVEVEDVLLHGVRGLREDQGEEQEPTAVTHSRSQEAVARVSSRYAILRAADAGAQRLAARLRVESACTTIDIGGLRIAPCRQQSSIPLIFNRQSNHQ
jgi:hypothetical protein